MIDIEKFQSEIQKNMQAMVNEHKRIIKENNELKSQVKQLEMQKITTSISKTDKEAVVFFAADISGSMGAWERNIGNEFKINLQNVLSEKYKSVTCRYIHHHTEAEMVSKDDFLKFGNVGGTIVSSAYRLINKELEDFDYHNENIDVFVVHISDGDNLTSDNLRVVKIFDKLFKKVDKIIYVETNAYNRRSNILNGLRGLNKDKFTYGVIENVTEIEKYIAELLEKHINKL